jgi:hypothetical protein
MAAMSLISRTSPSVALLSDTGGRSEQPEGNSLDKAPATTEDPL